MHEASRVFRSFPRLSRYACTLAPTEASATFSTFISDAAVPLVAILLRPN